MKVKLPFLMTGEEGLSRQFSGILSGDSFSILKSTNEGADSDQMNCLRSGTQKTFVCLASFPSLKNAINAEEAKNYLEEKNPLMTAEEVEARSLVSFIFASDAVGILNYQIKD